MQTLIDTQSQMPIGFRHDYLESMKPETIEYSPDNLRLKRKERRISQNLLAAKIGVNRNTVMSYEDKKNPVAPTEEMLAFIGWVLNIKWIILPKEPVLKAKNPSDETPEGQAKK